MQKGYREDHDQQDSHAGEREGAGPLKGNHPPHSLSASNAWFPAVMHAYSSRKRLAVRNRAYTILRRAVAVAAFDLDQEQRKIDIRQLRSLAPAAGFSCHATA